MATGGFYVDASGLTELADSLARTAGGVRDLSKVYKAIGKKAELYVKTHQPIYGGSPKDSRTHPPPGFMQSRTNGGGGKTAWVEVRNVPYIYVQEFGGSSYWYRGPAGLLRAMNRAHRSMAGTKVNGTGHVIYKKPRRPKGYFIWNVAWRLRSAIGRELTTGIQNIGLKHGLKMDVTDRNLDVKQNYWNRAA